MQLPQDGLVFRTWGNVSGLDKASGVLAIKPSGVPYGELSAENMVLVDLDGHVVEGDLNPSSDLATHLALYRAWPEIGGVAHTHSLDDACGLFPRHRAVHTAVDGKRNQRRL